MDIIARRLTIITLSVAIFAMAFSAIVNQSGHSQLKMRSGATAPCYHSASPYCSAVL